MDNDCDGEAPQFAVPAVPLPPPVADQDLGIVMMSSGDEGDDPGPKPPSPAAHPELGPPEVVPEPLPVEDGIVDVAPPPEVPVPLADGWPEKLEGIPLRKIAGRSSGPGGHNYFGRLGIQCPCPEHDSCQKTRSINLQTAEFGPQAALCYLGAWTEQFHLPQEEP